MAPAPQPQDSQTPGTLLPDSRKKDTSVRFSIFRASDAQTLNEQPIVRWTPPGSVSQQGWQNLVAAGYSRRP